VTIGGDVTGTGPLLGATNLFLLGQVGPGTIAASNSIGPVKIGGDLESFATNDRNGGLSSGTIGAVTIGGSIRSGHIAADSTIGAVVVKGGIVGTAALPATIEVLGTVKSSLASLTVSAGVERAKILIGTSLSGAAADSQIGAVKVGGAWIASDLIAGVKDVAADGFGNADDVKQPSAVDSVTIVSRIASITIDGPVLGTPSVAGDRFAFEAQAIGAFSVGGEAFALRPASVSGDNFFVGVTGDVKLREVP
jgi:hypothetical protein